MNFDSRLYSQMRQHPYPMLFTTISGAHLYGFPSPDSDFDLRGVHILPLRDMIGLQVRNETIERTVVDDGLEIDLVTHDAHKYFTLMMKKSGHANHGPRLRSQDVLDHVPMHVRQTEVSALEAVGQLLMVNP